MTFCLSVFTVVPSFGVLAFADVYAPLSLVSVCSAMPAGNDFNVCFSFNPMFGQSWSLHH